MNGTEQKPAVPGTYYGELSPGGEWRWNGTGLPNDDWVAVGQQGVVTPLAKPSVAKHHAWTMDKASMAFLTDLSAYPGLTYAQILIYPTAELVRKYGLS
jgi:hypothetical protein